MGNAWVILEPCLCAAEFLLLVWCLLMIYCRRMHGTGENGLEDLDEFDALLSFFSGEFVCRLLDPSDAS